MDSQFIDKIKTANDIVDVIGEYVALKKHGVNMIGICPFHADSHPSMSVSKSKQMYNCFVCGKKGDVIQFLQEHEHITFVEAVAILAKRAGIEFQQTEMTDEQKQRAKEMESMRIATKAASDYFISHLNLAKGYLSARGYDIEDPAIKNILTLFGVGYAPEGNLLKKWCSKAGYSESVMLKVDAIKKGEHGTYDAFQDRLMFPFYDLHGNITGFTGRIITPRDNYPKYQNTKETPLYTKGNQIFGLHQAKQAISRLGFAYLVEGQVDVISMHLAGTTNTIAGSGTAFTEYQVRLLSRFTQSICQAYDGDKAGIAASLKNAELFLRAGFTVKCVALPEGKDPDNIAWEKKEDTSKWFSNNSKDFVTYFCELMLKEDNSVDEMEEFLNTMCNLIGQIDSETKRAGYCRSLAKHTDSNPEELIRRTRNIFKKLSAAPDAAEMKPGIYGLDILEEVRNEGEECILTSNYDNFIQNYGENPVVMISGIPTLSDIQELRRACNFYIASSKECSISGDGIENDFLSALAEAYKAGINIMIKNEPSDYESDSDEEEDNVKPGKIKYNVEIVPFINAYVKSYGYFLSSTNKDRTPFIERCAEMISFSSDSVRIVNLDEFRGWLGLNKGAINEILKPYLEKKKSRMAINAQRNDDDDFDFDPDEIPSYVEENEEYNLMYKQCKYYPRLNKEGEPVCYIFIENSRSTQVGDFFMTPLLHIYSDNDDDNKRVLKINRRYYTNPLYIEVPSKALLKKSTIEERLINLEAVNFTNGEEKHWTKIKEFMSRRYITCTEVVTYGNQQTDGSSLREDEMFFAFANGIFHMVDGRPAFERANELGVVVHNKKNYYLPAFSTIYAGSGRKNDKYELISTLVYRDIPDHKRVTFEKWASLMDQVYKINNNGKWAILFAIMCAFRSNIHCIDRLFTAPFFMGPMSSGKTQIAISIRSLFISPKVPIFNLNIGTDAAMSTLMGTFRDAPVVLDEYNNKDISDIKFQALKGIVYDGDGRQKRKGTSGKEIENDKVYAPVIICGQETPQRDDNALMSRIIVCEVPKPKARTQEETDLFNELKEIEDPDKIGLSNVLFQVLQLRPIVMKHFKVLKQECYNELKAALTNSGEIDRMMKTASLFLATCKLIETLTELKLPFTYKEFFQVALDKIKFQIELISKTDKLATFFNAISVMIDTKAVVEGRDFSIEYKDKLTIKLSGKEKKEVIFPAGTRVLYLRVSSVYTKYAQSSFNKEESTQSTIEQNLRSHPSYIGIISAKRFRWYETEEVPAGGLVEGDNNQAAVNNTMKKIREEKEANSSCIALDYNIFRELYDIDLERKKVETTTDSVKQPLPF